MTIKGAEVQAMRVICRSRNRSELSIDRCRQYAEESADELTIGACYPVYGQALADGCLAYLIAPRNSRGLSIPSWYPAEWFGVTDNSMPRSWVFSYTAHHEAGGELAVWGYPELVTSYEHWAGLQEGDEAAMLTFYRRRIEIDSEEGESGMACSGVR